MKIAHLILAHSEPQQLARLVDRLNHRDAFFFIHIDKKISTDSFEDLKLEPRVYFVQDRVEVSWGAYSIVQATINGMKAIENANLKIDYVNLLSGSDYPIQSTQEIHSFFSEHLGENFMEFQSVQDEWKEAIPRLTEYHFTNYSFPGKYLVQKWLNKIAPLRRMPDNLVAVGRSQWMSITTEAVRYILNYLETHLEVVRFFKLTWAPDEIIFQTILYNSHFRNLMVNDNLRYIDWSAGMPSPRVLTEEDLEKLEASNALFARKFDLSKHPEVLDYLDNKFKLH